MSVDLLTAFRSAGGATPGSTVMGVVLELAFAPVQVVTANEMAGVRYGLIVAETGSIPSLVTQPMADWMWHDMKYFGVPHGLLTAGAPVAVHERVRSRRKVDEVGESLFLALECQATTSPTTFSFRLWTSVLLALP